MILGSNPTYLRYPAVETGGNIYIQNPDAAANGFVGKGYTTYGGRMYVDPSIAFVSNGLCSSSFCTTSGVSLGSPSSFNNGVVDSITLVQANASIDKIADYVINGIKISQTIPAMVPSGDYSINMTMSIIGNSTTASASSFISYDSCVAAGYFWASCGGCYSSIFEANNACSLPPPGLVF